MSRQSKGTPARISRRQIIAGAAAAAWLPLPAKAQSSPVALRFMLSRNLQAMPIHLGVSAGIYDKHGFDAKIRFADGGSAIARALQVNDADLGIAVFGSLISARGAAIPIKSYGILCGDSEVVNPDKTYGIVAARNSGIHKVSDLAGKRVGVMMGSTIEAYLRAVLANAKVPAESITFVNVVQHNARAAIASIDAVVTLSPFLEMCMTPEVGGRLVTRGGDLVSTRVTLVAADNWGTRNPALAERALLATVEAMQYTRTHLDEAAEAASQMVGSSLDPKVVREALQYFIFDPRLSPTIRTSWQNEDEAYLKSGRTKRSVPFDEAFDLSLMTKILKKHPQLVADFRKS